MSSIQINGDTSGSVTLQAPADAGSTTLTLPATTGTVALTSNNALAKAWCVFNGNTTGTNAPIAGFNVTSVTRTSTGSYTINFTTDLPTTGYATIVTVDANGAALIGLSYGGTVSLAYVKTYSLSAVLTDNGQISVAVFGG